MKTRKIGEHFDFGGITLEVVRDDDCVGCYFFDMCGLGKKPEEAGYCSEVTRNDGRAVRFKKISL